MNPFDLRKSIVEGNRREKLYRKSLEAARRVVNGENVQLFTPDKKTAKEFIDAVKLRIEEAPVL